jgi:hypothetical protein
MINIKLIYDPATGDIKTPDGNTFLTRFYGLERLEIPDNPHKDIADDLQWWLNNNQEKFTTDPQGRDYLQNLITKLLE